MIDEPLIKFKMRRLVSRGKEKHFNALFDELINSKQEIMEEIRTINAIGKQHIDNFRVDVELKLCAWAGVHRDQLKQKTRVRDVMSTRQFAMWVLQYTTEMSLMGIGRLYNKDHATVLHAKRAVEGRIATEKVLREELLIIFDQLSTEGYDREAKIMTDIINNVKPLYK